MNLIESKVGEFSLGEAFAIGLSKSVSERLLIPIIGNSSYSSGAVKLVGAWAIPKYVLKNKYGKIIGTGLAVDGVEDVIYALFRDLNFGSNPQSESGLLI